MWRIFLAGVAVGIVLMGGLVVAGGLSYKRDVAYVECERFAAPRAQVSIRSSPFGPAWGNPSFLEIARYGPPYDLLVHGTLPDGDATTALEITNLTVEADGTPVLSLPQVVVRVRSAPGGTDGATRSFEFKVQAFTTTTPARLRVTGTLSRLEPTRDKGERFTHVFCAHSTRHVALGRWSWVF